MEKGFSGIEERGVSRVFVGRYFRVCGPYGLHKSLISRENLVGFPR